MSIASTTNRVQYSITGASSSPLTIPFRYDEPGWLMVFYVADGSQSAQTLVNGADFSLSGNGGEVEGLLTLDASFLATVTNGALTISRFTPALQDLNLQYNQRLPAELLERALDRATMEIQDRDVNPGGIGSRAVMFPLTEPAGNSNVLDIPINRASKVWGGDANGEMVFLNGQELSSLVLGYLGGPPTTADYLAAISAAVPIRVLEPPNTATIAKFGQLAILNLELPYLTVNGLSLSGSPLVVPKLYLNGTVEGKVFYTSDPGSLFPAFSFGWVSSTSRWDLNRFSGLFIRTITSTENVLSPEMVTSWTNIGSITGTAEVDLWPPDAARVWINVGRDDSPPQWVEIITQNSFLSLSETDPEVVGQLFRTGTALQVSQG